MAIVLNRVNGLADSKWSGATQSVASCVGLDLHSIPGLVQVGQKLTKESGSTVTEFVKVRVACSNGYSFWFSSTSGKIWARKSDGTWSLAYTVSPTSGSAAILGAYEYNGYIYFATQNYLHRIAIADADDSWANVAPNWAAFTNGNANWHPMAIQNLTLFIGDGNLVACVDVNATFIPNALDIKTPLQIKCMDIYEFDIVLGTWVADTVNKTEMIRWDTVSPSWNVSKPIKEVGINAFMYDDDVLCVQAGRAGNWYYFNGSTLKPYKRIPGIYSNTAYGTVNPGAVGNYQGRAIFGFSNGSGNPAKQGVYTFGSYSKDYPKIMDLSWVVSPDYVSNIQVGAILVLDFDILVSWQNDNGATSYGVDKIDYTAKYASAYFETRMLFPEIRGETKVMQEIMAMYNSLPTGCNFTFSYSKNASAYVAMTGFKDDSVNAVRAILSDDQVGSLQFKVAFNVSGNDGPTMEAFGVELDETQ